VTDGLVFEELPEAPVEPVDTVWVLGVLPLLLFVLGAGFLV
jgi:hypothetical protein